MNIVPNQQPIYRNNCRLAIIGEAPGSHENTQRKPFVGPSGWLLWSVLSKQGIQRTECFVGNIIQIQPPGNNIKQASKWAFENGRAVLQQDLKEASPNLCLLLGNTPLQEAGKDKITQWRGSVFQGQGIFEGYKCMAAYHPAAVLRQPGWRGLFKLDIEKAIKEAWSTQISDRTRNRSIQLENHELLLKLQEAKDSKLIALDIEGGIDSMSCLSIATSPEDSFIVPFDQDLDPKVWSSLRSLLMDPSVGKILQNSLYDNFVLSYSYGTPIINVVEDTMLKGWEVNCELPKGLATLASLYTSHPFYKTDRKSDSLEVFHNYCCTDSLLTYEVSEHLDKKTFSKSHYQFNLSLLRPLLYMQLRGIKYNSEGAKERKKEIQDQVYEQQDRLDQISKRGLHHQDYSPDELDTLLRAECCFKRDPSKPKKGRDRDLKRGLKLIGLSDPKHRGELASLLGLSLNTKSPDLKKFLYEELGLPKVYKKDPITGKESLTTDYESLLRAHKKKPHPALECCLQLSKLRTRSQMLGIKTDPDGRIRCSYNVVGTETGRLSCSTCPTGSGYNLQTIPKYDRDLFLADDGYEMCQVDLSGADTWTVAAHCLRLGDPTMIEDLKYGIKMAWILAYQFVHGGDSLNGLNKEQIKELVAPIQHDRPDLYHGSKCCIHGSNYGMKKTLVSQTIFKQTDGDINIPAADCEVLQQIYFKRYPGVYRWQQEVKRRLHCQGHIASAGGHIRRFEGNPNDHSTFKEALAHEPQETTTYATKLALYNLWNDLSNRYEGGLRVQPLHTVHDSLIVQFRKTDKEWAIPKMKEWFSNEILIAGIPITIPFEGTLGSNWKEEREEI